jgi:hypothetical protein
MRPAMATIIEFPQNSEKFWRDLMPTLKVSLAKQGISESGTAWILADLKPRACALWVNLDIHSEIPIECKPALEDCANKFRALIHEIAGRAISEMLILEKALYFAKEDSSS